MNYFEIKTKYGGSFIEAEKEGGGISMYWLTGIAGFFLLVAPYLCNYVDNQAALWTSLAAGLVVLGASLWEGMENRKENWEYWTVGIVGVLTIIAPFILGFGSHVVAMLATVTMGTVIAVLAGSTLWNGGTS